MTAVRAQNLLAHEAKALDKLEARRELAVGPAAREKVGDEVARLARRVGERQARDAHEAALGEVCELAAARGEATVRPASGPMRVLCRDGLEWLIEKRRLAPALRDAGRHYRMLYLVYGDPNRLRSNVDFTVRGWPSARGKEARIWAREQLDLAHAALAEAARGRGWKRNIGAIIGDVAAVAGEGRTLRELAGGKRDAAATRERYLLWALEVVAGHWRLA